MATVVDILGVTHSPGLPRGIERGDDRFAIVGRHFEAMRRRLAEARPDVLVVVGSDHLNQWFMNNMPAFLVGKPLTAAGPFPSEQDAFGMPAYEAAVDRSVATGLVAGGFDHGVDFAFSDELVIDHSFTVPLALLRPEADLPIVPVNTNVMAPPFPSARRFFQVGQAIREVLEEQPGDQRIGVISSGHLSIEIGGPKMRVTTMRSGRPDPEFDETAMGHLGAGEIDDLIAFATPQRMMAAGNVTSGFLNFVLLAGVARGAKADQADCIGQSPFLAWNCS